MALKRINPIKIKMRRSDDTGIFHDSRADVRKLSEAINILIDKQNEVIEMVNKLIDLSPLNVK